MFAHLVIFKIKLVKNHVKYVTREHIYQSLDKLNVFNASLELILID